MSVAAPPAPKPAPRERKPVSEVLADHPLIMLGFLLVALLVACEIAQPGYLSEPQLGTILRLAAPLAILAAGQTLVMLTGGIDLSIGFTATAAAYIMAGQSSRGTLVAILIALGVGLLIGTLNGIGIGIFNVQPLIMTLGMGSIVIGLLTVRAQDFVAGAPAVPEFINELATGSLVSEVPKSILLWGAVAALVILMLRYSGFGRMLYAYGDNPTAVRLAGSRSWQMLIATYALCGVCAAVGGLLLVGLTNAADLGLATSYLLPAVAAVVIGGTSIFGGVGTYSGTIFGALILTVLDSFLTLIDVAQSVRQILYGTIILALAALYARLSGRR
ncbi:MAG TPA: ABC transporter permease [Capillimicrobium sp.]|jgi:ribose transport system permease protein